jgi:hypothetical protein
MRTDSNQKWQWRESKTVKRQDELVCGDRILATLRWEGWASTVAFAASAKGGWVFERPRLLSRDVEVRDGRSDRLVAVYMPGWLDAGGKLQFGDGRVLRWTADNFWRTKWLLVDASSDELLLSFEDTSGFFKTGALVRPMASARWASERVLLALLGWYFMALGRRDAAAAAATVTAATT